MVSSPCRRSAAGACADLLGECQQAEVYALAGVSLALPCSGKAAQHHVDGRGRLGDLLAFVAGKLQIH